MSVLQHPAIVWVACLVLAAVFAGAAYTKLNALEEFVGVLHNYRLLPAFLERPIAYALPPLEGMVAVGLLVGPTRGYAASIAGGLLIIFSAAMTINLLRGRRDIDCGCFASALKQRLSWGLVGRNGVLFVMALAALSQPGAAGTVVWLDFVTASAAATALILLYAAYTRLTGMAPAGENAAGGSR